MSLDIPNVVDWLKNWFYTDTETDTLLSGKSNINHGHSWEIISSSANYPEKYTFYVNSKLNLAELVILYKPSADISATHQLNLNIGENYAPTGITVRRSNKSGIDIGIDTHGGVYSYGNITSGTTVQASVMWHYNAPIYPTVSLTSDKSILSYYDSESATLSATVLDANGQAWENVTVEFFNGSTSMGTATTDSNGVATKTYNSIGAGDVTFTAETNDLTSETWSIKDAYYYHESAFTSTQNNFDVPLPSSFEITFYTKRTSSSSNSAYLEVGGNTGNTALCGQIGGSGQSRVRIYNSEGSSSYTDHSSTDTPSNTLALHTWVKNGNDNSYHTQSVTPVTWTDNITHSKIRKLSITSNLIEQLLVMPK